jgi:MFS transporter, ACDE family, multidrug resistance protein
VGGRRTGAAGTDGVDPRVAHRATWALIGLRAGYAFNWFNVGPALVPIGVTFGVGPADWGLLVAVFLLGAGAFQVPAGFWARRWGPRTVALVGAGLLAAASAGSAFAPSFLALLVARLFAGIGAALFFSPAIGLVANLYPPGRRGLPVGAFSSAFSGGAAAGIFVTAIAVPLIGWRSSILLGGLGLAVLTLVAAVLVPRSTGRPAPRPTPSRRIPAALRFRGPWVVGLAFVGLEGASFGTGQFIVPFGEAVRGWSAALAGAVGLAFVLPSLAGGPVGGVLAERRPNHRTQFVVATVAGAVVLVALPVAGPLEAALIGAVFSFAYGFVYAVMYVLPHYWRAVPAEEVPLAIGLFNGIQLGGGAAVSFAFGWFVAHWSYGPSWVALAGLAVVPLGVLVLLPPTRPAAVAGPPAGAAPGPP